MQSPGEEHQKMKSKIEMWTEMEENGFVLGNPERILRLFRRNKFRRLVLHMGVGQIHHWFVHKFVIEEDGAGAPKFRNLHLHNGSNKDVRSVTIQEEPHIDDDPVMAPPNGDVILPDEWAINDSFEPEGHMDDVGAIKVQLEMPSFLGLSGQRYEALIDPARPGEKIETVWLNILDGADTDFQLESVIWMGADESAMQPVTPPIVPMNPIT